MGYYTIRLKTDELDPLSEIGNREISTWRGCKNNPEHSKYVTDGTIFVDRKHVESQELFSKLKDRESDDSVSDETVNQKIESIKEEDQNNAKILGQALGSQIGMGSVKAKWIAVVKTDGGSYVADASAVDIVQQLLDGSGTLKIGTKTEVITWWKYGVPVGGVATWDYFDVELNQ